MFESDKVMANRARFFNTMNNFLTWCALRQYINYASRPFRKAHQEFYKGLMGGKVVDQRYSIEMINYRYRATQENKHEFGNGQATVYKGQQII